AGDLLLEGGELGLGVAAALLRLGEVGAQASELGLGGLRGAAAGGDLPGEAGEPLAAVGDATVDGGQRSLGLALGLLQTGALGDDGVPCGAGGLDLRGERLLLLAGAGGAGVELLRIGAAVLLGGCAEEAGALGGQGVQAAQALAQPREGVPRVGRLARERRGGRGLRLEGGGPAAGGVCGGVDGGAALPQGGLVGDLPL